MNKEEKHIDSSDLPQQDAFKKREVYQHPQPQDTGAPLNSTASENEKLTKAREEQKTSKMEGLNEEKSAGHAGPFEGFEDQQKD